MEILTAEQFRQADAYTIRHAPVASIDLMERAASACYRWIAGRSGPGSPFYLFCGPGNNGGDGLALARMLYLGGYAVRVFVVGNQEPSPDHVINLERLHALLPEGLERVETPDDFPGNLHNGTIVDALFGTGLSRPLEGIYAAVVRYMNGLGLNVVSIDMPSGLQCDATSLHPGAEVMRAHITLTFQYLKKALLVPENQPYFGYTETLDIGLVPEALTGMDVRMHRTDPTLLASMHRPRPLYAHKGTFGHALILAGSPGKMGAAILAASGYLRSGGGLLTLLVDELQFPIIQGAVPEAMAVGYEVLTHPDTASRFTTFGAGPGMGTSAEAEKRLRTLLTLARGPMVLDADALSLLGAKQELVKLVPQHSILTPHPGEFRRLAGDWTDDFDKLNRQQAYASKHQVYVLLKGKNSTIATPEGVLWFNPTGNSGMARGGTGDVLTGLLTGLLASGYPPRDACVLGAWLHGKSGDLSAELDTKEGMQAGDVARNLGGAWKALLHGH